MLVKQLCLILDYTRRVSGIINDVIEGGNQETYTSYYYRYTLLVNSCIA